jgi:hypothetical protein
VDLGLVPIRSVVSLVDSGAQSSPPHQHFAFDTRTQSPVSPSFSRTIQVIDEFNQKLRVYNLMGLSAIDLRSNRIAAPAMLALFRSFSQCPHLTTLHVLDNPIGPECAAHLARDIATNPCFSGLTNVDGIHIRPLLDSTVEHFVCVGGYAPNKFAFLQELFSRNHSLCTLRATFTNFRCGVDVVSSVVNLCQVRSTCLHGACGISERCCVIYLAFCSRLYIHVTFLSSRDARPSIDWLQCSTVP